MLSKTKLKTKFLNEFLNNYELRKIECSWILQYIHYSEEILENVHFVTGAAFYYLLKNKQRLIIMTAKDSDMKLVGVPFKFFTGNSETEKAKDCYLDIQVNTSIPLFIIIESEAEKTTEWKNVIEDFNVDIIVKKITQEAVKTVKVKKKIKGNEAETTCVNTMKIIDNLILNSGYQFKLNQLNRLIDYALERRNKKLFIKYTNELKRLDVPVKLFKTVKK